MGKVWPDGSRAFWVITGFLVDFTKVSVLKSPHKATLPLYFGQRSGLVGGGVEFENLDQIKVGEWKKQNKKPFTSFESVIQQTQLCILGTEVFGFC